MYACLGGDKKFVQRRCPLVVSARRLLLDSEPSILSCRSDSLYKSLQALLLDELGLPPVTGGAEYPCTIIARSL